MLPPFLSTADAAVVLYIPVRLIIKIKIRPRQKLALAFSLCLTIVMIIVTLIRASGLRSGDRVDSVWETYWQFISAETGLIMTAVTAFRAFFLSRNDPGGVNHQSPSLGTKAWYMKAKRLVRRVATPRSWHSKLGSGEDSGKESRKYSSESTAELPEIPRATMTGIRTYINHQRITTVDGSRIMRSETGSEDGDFWPLAAKTREKPVINVRHDIDMESKMVGEDQSNRSDCERLTYLSRLRMRAVR